MAEIPELLIDLDKKFSIPQKATFQKLLFFIIFLIVFHYLKFSMDNQLYNTTVTQFYSSSYLQIGLKDLSQTDIHWKTKKLFDKFCQDFHSTLAYSFLYKLETRHETLLEKLKHYPEEFWKTSDGEKTIESGAAKMIVAINRKILHHINHQEKPSDDFFYDFLDEIFELYAYYPEKSEKILEKTYHALVNDFSKSKENYPQILLNQLQEKFSTLQESLQARLALLLKPYENKFFDHKF